MKALNNEIKNRCLNGQCLELFEKMYKAIEVPEGMSNFYTPFFVLQNTWILPFDCKTYKFYAAITENPDILECLKYDVKLYEVVSEKWTIEETAFALMNLEEKLTKMEAIC